MKKKPRKPAAGVDRLGRTPLHYAASEGRAADAASLLLEGAVPNAADDQGWTPLHFAARSGAAEIARLLLRNAAEVDAIDSNGNSPLWRAVFACTDDGSVIEMLRAAGAGAAGMAGNVLVGGLIGIGVDAASGATKELKPNPLKIAMAKKAVPAAVAADATPPVAAPVALGSVASTAAP